MFSKKDALKNLEKLAEKSYITESFFNQDVELLASHITKKNALSVVISCEFCKKIHNSYSTEHQWTVASKKFMQVQRLMH